MLADRRAADGLKEIVSYCEKVSYTVHRFGGKEQFVTDYDYQSSCVFSIQQIGEIVKNNYDWLTSNSPDFDWKGFARFRDFAAHNYHHPDFNLLWDTVNEDIPAIWNECLRLLGSMDAEASSDDT